MFYIEKLRNHPEVKSNRMVMPSPPKSVKMRTPSVIMQTKNVNYNIFLNKNTKSKSK